MNIYIAIIIILLIAILAINVVQSLAPNGIKEAFKSISSSVEPRLADISNKVVDNQTVIDSITTLNKQLINTAVQQVSSVVSNAINDINVKLIRSVDIKPDVKPVEVKPVQHNIFI